jgi:hypothetical protein
MWLYFKCHLTGLERLARETLAGWGRTKTAGSLLSSFQWGSGTTLARQQTVGCGLKNRHFILGWGVIKKSV